MLGAFPRTSQKHPVCSCGSTLFGYSRFFAPNWKLFGIGPFSISCFGICPHSFFLGYARHLA